MYSALGSRLSATALLLAAPLYAQQAAISVGAGTGTDQLGGRSSAVTVAPSLSFAKSDVMTFTIGANVTRFAQLWSFGGGASLSDRIPIAGPVAFTLDGNANASSLSTQSIATFASGEILPALQLDAGPLTLFGGARLAAGYHSQIIQNTPMSPFVASMPRTDARSVSAMGPTLGATLLAAHSDDAELRIGGRVDRLDVDGVSVNDATASLSVTSGVVSVAGSAGHRNARDENVGFGSAALSIAMSNGASLDIGAGKYASNRLTATPGGTYVNAGVSFRFGAAERRKELPGAPPLAPGMTRLTIEAPDARRVDVAGDFTEWMSLPAKRADDGMWYADLRLDPGQYRYAFRVNGKEWRVPRGAVAVDDGFGGKSTWITVSESSSTKVASKR